MTWPAAPGDGPAPGSGPGDLPAGPGERPGASLNGSAGAEASSGQPTDSTRGREAVDGAVRGNGAVPSGGADADEPPTRAGRRGRQRRGSFWRELPILILVALVLTGIITTFVVQAFYIPSGSMERTLLIRDRVLVNKIPYRYRDPHRGEIVVFNGTGTPFQPEVSISPPANIFDRLRRDVSSVLGLGQPGEKDFIKRVIGTPGDTVACCVDGHVTVNGQPLDETYVFEDDPLARRSFGPVVVPPNRLFVMGDHRSQSGDSRLYGTIPINKVVGRAVVRFWPLSRISLLTVPHTFASVPKPTPSQTPAASGGGARAPAEDAQGALTATDVASPADPFAGGPPVGPGVAIIAVPLFLARRGRAGAGRRRARGGRSGAARRRRVRR